MTQILANMTPVEIDTILAPIWEREANVKVGIRAKVKLIAQRDELIQLVLEQKLTDRKVREARITTPADGIMLMQRRIMAEQELDLLRDRLAKIQIEAAPYEGEYRRRGGWNRVFLATSSKGHAHNGMECSTCHHGEFRTSFAWLIQYSGEDESEIVADAGERACTTCYPTAPVNAKGTKMFTPDEEEAAKARQAREEAKAEKARQADVKGITTPEGQPLDIGRHGYRDIAKTLRTAEIAATDFLVDLIIIQRQSGDPEFAWLFQNGQTVESRTKETSLHAWHVLRAIAAKKDLNFWEVFETHERKAQAKVRKNDREWAKDPRNPNRSK
jgi:hypothetical protein